MKLQRIASSAKAGRPSKSTKVLPPNVSLGGGPNQRWKVGLVFGTTTEWPFGSSTGSEEPGLRFSDQFTVGGNQISVQRRAERVKRASRARCERGEAAATPSQARRFELAALTTSRTASGCLATIRRRILALPSGFRRPCSQLRRVAGLMPMRAANFDWLKRYLFRTALTSGSPKWDAREGLLWPRRMAPPSRTLSRSSSKRSRFMGTPIRRSAARPSSVPL